jgi:GTP-binding protein HflX
MTETPLSTTPLSTTSPSLTADPRFDGRRSDPSRGDMDLEQRSSLRRVAGLSTELTDITEVEYRQLRLERVVLVGVWTEGTSEQANASMVELARLAETAGSTVLDGLVQRRSSPDPATFIGSGKVEELKLAVQQAEADTVICDGELSPGQLRQLEERLKVKVIDRTALILDIFAQHARSRDGKAQVELAQLSYLLPRLRGWGEALSRQVGGRAAGGVGIGGRGPGETKIELDRRRIRNRMSKLRREITAMSRVRDTQRGSRRKTEIPGVAIVGYTNAGKSSLLNALTNAGVLVEDALFATLDPTTRRAETPDGRAYTLTDTVGFVRHLPHQLVEAFRSTLEESAQADLLVHVVDASDPLPEDQIAAVRKVLVEIGETQGIFSSRGCGTSCPTPCSSPHTAGTASSSSRPASPSACRAPRWTWNCWSRTPRAASSPGCTPSPRCSRWSTSARAPGCTCAWGRSSRSSLRRTWWGRHPGPPSPSHPPWTSYGASPGPDLHRP